MKRKTKFGAVLCCSTALVSILGGYLLSKNAGLFNFNNQANQNSNIGSELQVEQQAENMRVALLNKTENQDGSISYTYNFTITPENATRKDISGTLSFIDGTEGIEEFLTFSIDQANMQFTITKKADFSHRAQLVLKCNADPSVRATMTLDCKQHFLGFNDVSEKTYRQVLSENDSVSIDALKVDGATEINAGNFTSVFTVRTNTGYRVEQISAHLTGYVTGDAVDDMSDSGLTIDNTYAISQVDLTNNFTLSALYEAVYADSGKMPGTDALTFSQRNYFGIAYDLTLIYNVDNVIKNYTAHMVAVANTTDLDFGVPTGLTLEKTVMSFEKIETVARFVFTDQDGEVSYIDAEVANGTGWFSTGYRTFYKGYINIELTRKLDGQVVSGPTVVYTLNNGKGYYCGTDRTSYYIVYNPGGYDSVRWLSTKQTFNPYFVSISNYACSTY